MTAPKAKSGTFDPDTHTYRLANGQRVPSVTQVLRAVLPAWSAGEWYLQRGRAVHACVAMIARGQEFQHDPQISGQVAAARRFFAEVSPEPYDIEKPLFSERYGFAGTPDMIGRLDGRRMVFDWKSALYPEVQYQLAAYGLLSGERWGVAVAFNENGTYTMGHVHRLDGALRAGWLAMLAVHRILVDLGHGARGQEETDGDTEADNGQGQG